MYIEYKNQTARYSKSKLLYIIKYLTGDFFVDENPLRRLGFGSVSVFTAFSRLISKFAKLIGGIEIGTVGVSGFSSGLLPLMLGIAGIPGSMLGTDPASEAIGLGAGLLVFSELGREAVTC